MMRQSSQAALERLKSGNDRFTSDASKNERRDGARRRELVEAQEPFAVILSCSDSRVVPEFIFDAGLGELVVIRVAGNIPNPSSIATIEFAVAYLGVELIVILGHEACWAVNAAIDGGEAGKNFDHLLGFIQPAVTGGEDKSLGAVVRRNVQNSREALTTESKILRDAFESGSIQIITAYYHLETGRVDFASSG